MVSNETLATLYREEAGEHLAALEAALLELEQQPQDAEIVSRVFRALHTIKGSGAMAGYNIIAAIAHETESVFARIRQGGLKATPEIIRLALETKDMIRALLDPENSVSEASREVLRRALQALLGQGEVPAPKAAQVQDQTVSSVEGESAKARISWKPHPDLFHNGSNPLGILAELDQMGTCETTTNLDALPPLVELEPDTCYLSYEIVMNTNKTENEIRDVFAFVEDLSDLSIRVTSGSTPESATPEVTAAPVLSMPVPVPEVEETKEKAPKKASSKSETSGGIRVPAAKLDSLVDLVGELVIAQARLAQLSLSQHQEELISVAEDIGRLSAALRDNTLDLRMVPIGTTFGRFKRLVHDLSSELGKDVQLVTDGAETELDKTMIERLSDPLVHLIRNSCDHGIESPEVRRQSGKSALGTVQLRAYHLGQSVFIEIQDDGAGLDAEAIRNKAVAGGLLDASASLSEQEMYRLILSPGFSTAKTVTNVSGRGVGMDVVKRAVDALRGHIDISSEKGKGTTFRIRLPLTLAIIEGLLVQVGTGRFILPMSAVEECVELTASEIERSHGNRLADVRGSLIPYIRLREWFETPGDLPAIEQIAIISLDGARFGLVVDAIVGQYQTVIKSLGRVFQHVQGLSGATILGDGSVALVIDVQSLLQSLPLAA